MAQRRLLIPCLATIGQESGFAVKTTAPVIRIRTFQNGTLVNVCEQRPSQITRGWRSHWAADLPASNEELNTVELEGETSGEVEGELLFRNGQQQTAVLTGMVPLRDAGFKFSPILHQAHYNVLLDHCETYIVLANLVAEGDPPAASNRMQVEIRSLSSAVLAVVDIDVGLNSTISSAGSQFRSKTRRSMGTDCPAHRGSAESVCSFHH